MGVRFFAFGVASLLGCALTTSAVADEQGRAPEPNSHHGWVATLDALGAVRGRLGVQVEYLVTPHDGLAFYPWILAHGTSGTSGLLEGDPDYGLATSTRAVGLDFQYRHYTGPSEGRGFFVAPGLEAQAFATDTSWYCLAYDYNHDGAPCEMPPSREQTVGYLGVSFDLGFQAILPSGLVLMASGGLQARGTLGSLDQQDLPWLWKAEDGPGLRPRLRLAIGWAWL
jgi:hypothetical protein